MNAEKTYMILRFHQYGDRTILQTGLSLDEAKAHCKDPETSSRTATGRDAVHYTRKYGPWFDGYEEEDE